MQVDRAGDLTPPPFPPEMRPFRRPVRMPLNETAPFRRHRVRFPLLFLLSTFGRALLSSSASSALFFPAFSPFVRASDCFVWIGFALILFRAPGGPSFLIFCAVCEDASTRNTLRPEPGTDNRGLGLSVAVCGRRRHTCPVLVVRLVSHCYWFRTMGGKYDNKSWKDVRQLGCHCIVETLHLSPTQLHRHASRHVVT